MLRVIDDRSQCQSLCDENKFDLHEDIIHIMGLHSAEAAMKIFKEGGYLCDSDEQIERFQDHLTQVEAYLWHFRRSIREANLLLEEYRGYCNSIEEHRPQLKVI